MSTNISPDVAYVLKNLNEIINENRKRKHDFIVQYHEDERLNGNNFLTIEETQTQPTVEVENVDDKIYRTLIMVDPDAPSRDNAVKGPVLHWLIANFQSSSLADGRTLYPYNGPAPPAGSGPHRYIFFLYQSIDKISEKKFGRDERLCFPLHKYIIDNQLELFDATYFTINNN